MKKTMRLIFSSLTTIVLTACILLSGYTDMESVKAAGTTYSGSNINAQNYTQWSATVKSYLTATADGYMRVQSASSVSGYLVEYYDASYKLTKTVIVNKELPIFGAFYETEDNYYILSGQSNPNESDDVEVYRVTKYDKQWNRIAYCGLLGANTRVPFDAGSARMAHSGDQLVILTCHTMYKSEDGYNHQANVTIQVNMSNMTVTDSHIAVSYIGTGYVSHSFNQFVGVDDNHIVSVNHGDAYPRSIVLVKYAADISSGRFTSGRCSDYNLLEFEGAVGNNYTGASIGGFAISDSSYIVAGNQDINADNRSSGRNIFILSQDKTTNETTKKNITNYATGDGAYTPHLVTLAANRYLLLWNKKGVTYYTELDGTGTPKGSIYSLKGELSDCVPLVANGKVIWYTWENESVTFYEISTSDLSKTNIVPNPNSSKQEVSSEEQSGSKDNDTSNGSGSSNNSKLLNKGTTVKDSQTGVSYKVTKSDAKNGTVEYIGKGKTAKGSITIPTAVNINGITYKVTSIAKDAFKGNKSITNVKIGKNVSTIGKNAFYGCTKLKTVTMGSSVTKIDDKAFYNCTALKKITIPSKVNKIGKSAFEKCKNLKTITIKTTKLSKSKVGSKAFKGIATKATIKVPSKKLSSYKKMLRARGVGKKAKIKK